MIWKKKKDAANQSAGEAPEAKTSSGAAAFAKKNWKWLAPLAVVLVAVSYTHLDVYKRQSPPRP